MTVASRCYLALDLRQFTVQREYPFARLLMFKRDSKADDFLKKMLNLFGPGLLSCYSLFRSDLTTETPRLCVSNIPVIQIHDYWEKRSVSIFISP